MQTFDRDVPQIRGCFRPRSGHVFVSWDAAQIEARLAAHFSGDRRMIADFLEADATGGHFFLTMASKIYSEQIGKRDPRYTMTKNATYAQFYGSGLEKAAVTAGVSVDQMRPVYEGLRELYPAVGEFMSKIVRDNKRANHRPQVRTAWGRRLYVDRGKEYAGVDYTIQGTAADILKAATVAMDAQGYGELLRLTIHDEIFAEVPVADAQDVLRAGTEILTDRVSWAVPILWEGAIMTERWEKS
jgi:DNA polymerase I-like protein with 3'-5' exonuclease and polymerase domains